MCNTHRTSSWAADGARLCTLRTSTDTSSHFWRDALLAGSRRSMHKRKALIARTGSRFIEKKKSSQYGPYLLASFRAVTRICRISGTHMHGNSASHNDTSPALFLREPPREGNSHRLLEDLKKSGIHKFQVCGKDGAQVECRQCQASPLRAKAASGAYSAAETTVLSCAESAFKWF